MTGNSDAADSDADTRGDGTLRNLLESLAVTVRSARRRTGVNQRALAASSGVPHTTVARIEAGEAVGLRAVIAVLGAAGYRLAVVAANGRAVDVAPHPADDARDTGGRRLPAHLDVVTTRHLPEWTFTRRMIRRDRRLYERGPFTVYRHRPAGPAVGEEP